MAKTTINGCSELIASLRTKRRRTLRLKALSRMPSSGHRAYPVRVIGFLGKRGDPRTQITHGLPGSHYLAGACSSCSGAFGCAA
jgi:hypothetical protein